MLGYFNYASLELTDSLNKLFPTDLCSYLDSRLSRLAQPKEKLNYEVITIYFYV